jgi:hypothetical protein
MKQSSAHSPRSLHPFTQPSRPNVFLIHSPIPVAYDFESKKTRQPPAPSLPVLKFQVKVIRHNAKILLMMKSRTSDARAQETQPARKAGVSQK